MSGIELAECNPKIQLFVNVQNAREVRDRVMKAELPCAVLNPKFVNFPIAFSKKSSNLKFFFIYFSRLLMNFKFLLLSRLL